jgi:hypothetical protein
VHGSKISIKKVVERHLDQLKSIFTIFFLNARLKTINCQFYLAEGIVMYLNYKLKYRPEIPRNDYRNSLLFHYFVIKKKITTLSAK